MVQPQPATKAPRSCLLTSTHSGMGRRMGGVNGKAMEEIIITVIIIYTKQVMHNAIAHHPMNNTQPIPEQQSLPPVYTLSMTSYGIEYPL